MMKIGNFNIGERTLVIAEIGNNHEGDFATAKLLLERAAESGVDAVKFQTIRAERFVSRDEKDRFNQIRRFELADSQFRELALLAEARELLFLSTPFDVDSADMLDEFVPAFKVASGDLNWYQFLEHLALKGKPILLSTGMAEVDEISRALETIRQASPLPPNESVVLLHCVSAYPAPVREANLLSISYLRERFGVPVGYSDHTSGILVCETAAALGARVIEKHFTYRMICGDMSVKEGQAFRDHALSAEPGEMKELVARIRLIEASLGANDKKLMEIEKQNRVAMRRSLAAGKNLSRGETITGKTITFLRPGTGIPPEGLPSIIGRRAARDIAEGSIIEEKDIE